ncbi:MAG: DUF1499 domain-containing protein [Methylococcaceae bacterium]
MALFNSMAANAATRLPPCPDSPNCVSSLATDAGHKIAPFRIIGPPERAWAMLKQALRQQARTVITEDNATVLHAQTSSLIFRFVDDIDAMLDDEMGLIHIRSASRVGYSDFGVNRKRLENLRLQLQKQQVIE